MRQSLRKILEKASAPFRSVRFRLTIWAVILLSLVLAVFSVFIYTTTARNISDSSLTQLTGRMRQVESFYRLAILNYFTNGALQFPQTLPQGGLVLQDYETLALIDPQGQIIQKLGPISDTQVNNLAQAYINSGVHRTSFSYIQADLINNQDKSDQPYLFGMTTISLTGQDANPGLLLLGRPVDQGGQLHVLLLTLILASAAFIALTLAGGYWLAGRVMHPVHLITRAAREISETDLRRRLNLKSKDELGELANTFDQMLARLQAAFDRQRQFTADASHELRTPLTIVHLEAARALERRRSTEDYVRALSVIQTENEYMACLVNDLLTLARMDAGQASLKMEVLDLSDVTLEVAERLAPIANQNGVQLVTGDLPEIKVEGDRQYLVQMILNLVENAIKYVTGDHKQVFIETGTLQEGKTSLGWVRIEDNGPGIAPEHLPHLFDRFYRVDAARSQNNTIENGATGSEQTSGSGLGLAIVRWIAQAHHGDVLVTSKLGKGSVFEARLPVIKT